MALVAFGAFGFPSLRPASAKGKGCPKGMVQVQGRYCIDAYEASTVEVLPRGKTRTHSPFSPVAGKKVKAVSKKGVKPQAYISRDQAEDACQSAGKRLCSDEEWLTACKGKRPTSFPYGDERKNGYCNDGGVSSFNHYYGEDGAEAPLASYTWANMNDGRLNQLKGTLANTGAHKRCKSSFGVYDMVGNLHEWTAAKGGTFRGGYYLDTTQNGDGCAYKTTAHAPSYHDYSTGFRCCK
ncbi:formylglycine-generating enzyme family protein [Chondromyces apiculatus]|uniref:Sulfatase-modifying factor 2 (C-alpha-formyglycine-generating enzyme 2) n=1 Tax=Chondromyces apiculatus DSM 436 TaxID=1192034 RepID=A0A017TH36_9BACT|nr:SUMF1/EgtB/PvdO family nonheme iron enzyme [Chondromyces apiculatus]EYF07936.1 Sulfatase-modifying factor 2 precursor (C-alpha-formyglycine-generating enzyme 2) [Chondromyces apiculatus DSM 436]